MRSFVLLPKWYIRISANFFIPEIIHLYGKRRRFRNVGIFLSARFTNIKAVLKNVTNTEKGGEEDES